MRQPVTRLLVPLLLALAGCSLADFADLARKGDDAPEPPPLRTCDRDDQCDRLLGEVCRKADGSGAPIDQDGASYAGICVIPASHSERQVFLEISPLARSDQPVVQLGPVRLAEGQNQSLVVPTPVVVKGEVAYASKESPKPVEHARVRFKQPSPLIPGRPLVFEVETGSDEVSGEFKRLLPQGSYYVSVTPPDRDGVRAPPERPLGSAEFQVVPTLSYLPPLHLEVTDPNQLMVFEAQVQFERDHKLVPAEGIQVYAYDDSGRPGIIPGAAAAPRLIAQPVRTGKDGWFTLWLPRKLEETAPGAPSAHELKLQFGPAAGGQPFPSVQGPRFAVTRDTRLAEPIQLGRIDAPVQATGEVYAPDGQPLAYAQVTLHTSPAFERDAFRYSVTTSTDAGGHWEATVFPASYEAVAEPTSAQSATLGRGPLGLCPLDGEVPVGADGVRGLPIFCQTRRYFFGTVLSAALRPVSSVVVEAVRRPDRVLADERREQVVTDSAGAFTIALSPGVYDLSFQPSPEQKLPFASLAGLTVTADGPQLPQRNVVLAPPFELFGQLESALDGQPVGGTIEAYAVGPDGVQLIGRGLAQRDGRYSIVLPTTTSQ